MKLNEHPVRVVVSTREITLEEAVKNGHKIMKRYC